jgi:hypothetical protein
MIDPERYLNPDGTYDWTKFNLLTEDEQNEIEMTWDEKQRLEWLKSGGFYTLEEFREFLMEIIEEEFGPDNE